MLEAAAVSVLTRSIVGVLAKEWLPGALKSWFDRPTPQLAIEVALARCVARLEREYPTLAPALVDQHFLADSVPVLAHAVSKGPDSAREELAGAWANALDLRDDAEVAEAAEAFVGWWLEELQRLPEFQALSALRENARGDVSLELEEAQLEQRLAGILELPDRQERFDEIAGLWTQLSDDALADMLAAATGRIGDAAEELREELDQALLPTRYAALDRHVDRRSRAYVRSAPPLFGREWVIEEIEQFAEAAPCGYVSVVGEPGVGKTAFAAAFAARHDAPAFFFGAGGDPDQCLNHLCAELIERFDLGHLDLPERRNERARFLPTLLAEACGRAGKVWLVIDALDETQSETPDALRLPEPLPQGAFVLVTHRQGYTPVAPGVLHATVTLRRDDPRQLADVRKYVLDRLARETKLAGDELDRVAADLAQRSQGYFLFANELLKTPTDLERVDLDRAPATVHGFYEELWRTAASDASAWTQRILPVMRRLAAAREPVGEDWLCDHANLTQPEVRSALDACAQVLASSGTPPRWSLFHSSFAEFVRNRLEVDVRGAHLSIAGFYLENRDRWGDHGGYASRHVAAHLRLAGEQDRLFELIEDEDWRQTQLRDDPSGERYVSDIAQAWDSAIAADAEAVERGHGVPPMLLPEVSCALATAEVHSMAGRIPPPLLARLLEAGVWDEEAALAVAWRNPGPFRQAQALAALAPRLSDSRRSEEIAKSVEFAAGAAPVTQALTAAVLAPHLSEGQRKVALANAVRATRRRIRASDLCHVLKALAPHLSEPLLEEALGAASALEDGDLRTLAVTALAPHLTGELVGRALRIAQATQNPYTRAELMVALADRIPGELRGEAWEAARNIGVGIARSRVVAALLPGLDPAVRERAVEEAANASLETVRAVDRAASLAPLVPYLGDERREAAMGSAVKSSDIVEYALAMAALAPYLPPEGLSKTLDIAIEAPPEPRGRLLVSLAQHLPAPRLALALHTAIDLEDVDARSRALAALAPRLPERRLDEVVTAAAEIPEPRARARAIAAVAGRLSAAPVLARALEAAPTNDADACAQVLAALAPRLDADLLPRALDTAREAIDPGARARVLAALATRLEGQQRERAVARARRAARQGDATTRALLVAALPTDVPDLDRDEALVASDARPESRVRLAIAVAPHLSEGRRSTALADAVDAASAVAAPEARARLLAMLIPHLSDAEHRRALGYAHAAATKIAAARARARVLADLVPVAGDLRASLAEEALATAELVGDLDARGRVLAAVGDEMDPDEASRILEAAENASSPEVAAAVLARLAELPWMRIRAQAAAVMAATTAGDATARARAFTAAAAFLPDRLLRDAQEAAAGTSNAEDRTRLLAALAPRLDGEQRRLVLRDALSGATTPEERSRALRHVAPCIREASERHELWVEELRAIATKGVRSLALVFEPLCLLLPFASDQEAEPAQPTS